MSLTPAAVVEGSMARFNKACPYRWFDAVGFSLKETHAEVCSSSLIERETTGARRRVHSPPSPSPGLCDRKQNVQIAQLDPLSDAIVPAHAYPVANLLTSCSIMVFTTTKGHVATPEIIRNDGSAREPQTISHFVELLVAGMALGCSVWPLGAAPNSPIRTADQDHLLGSAGGPPTSSRAPSPTRCRSP